MRGARRRVPFIAASRWVRPLLAFLAFRESAAWAAAVCGKLRWELRGAGRCEVGSRSCLLRGSEDFLARGWGPGDQLVALGRTVADYLDSGCLHPHCVFKVSYLHRFAVSPKTNVSVGLYKILGRLTWVKRRRVSWIIRDGLGSGNRGRRFSPGVTLLGFNGHYSLTSGLLSEIEKRG